MGRSISEVKIAPGELVSFHGKNYEIKQLSGGLKTVILEDLVSSKLITAEIRYLQPFILENENKVPSTVIEFIPESDWEIAQKRLAIIRPLLENSGDGLLLKKVAKENNVSKATLYRWIEKFKSTGQTSSLVANQSDGGKGGTRLTKELEVVIKAVIEEIYLTKQKNPLKKVCREVVRRCKNLQLEPPHINTVRNRIKSLSQETRIRYRLGNKAADDKFKPVTGHFPNANYPLSVVQIDHTPMDIILVDEIYRKPIGRPWITLAIDVYSRMIVGLYISFDTPGFLGTGMCIANCILPKESWLNRLDIDGQWPCWGKMDTLHFDNAKEFRGSSLEKACQEYGINIEFRPVKTPNWGGHIERLIGTILREVHTLPGATFSNTTHRGEYNSQAKASFTLKEFETWLITFIVNVYHQRVHSSLGTTPQIKFEEGLFQSTGLPARIVNENKVKLDFLPFVERTIQEYGVVIDHIHYFSDVLRKWIHSYEVRPSKSKLKRKFIFKRDPRDISVLYFYDPDLKEYFNVPYRDTSRPAITLWEHKEILNRLERSGIRDIDENVIFDAYEKLKQIEDTAVSRTLKARRIKKVAKTKSSMEKSLMAELPEADNKKSTHGNTENYVSKPIFTNIKPFDEIEI